MVQLEKDWFGISKLFYVFHENVLMFTLFSAFLLAALKNRRLTYTLYIHLRRRQASESAPKCFYLSFSA
jgi:hypothetical protein